MRIKLAICYNEELNKLIKEDIDLSKPRDYSG
jgi:hypothetical protein